MKTETYYLIERKPVHERAWYVDEKCDTLEDAELTVKRLQRLDKEEFNCKMEYRIVEVTRKVVR